MKFYVSYLLMNSDIANPLWHSGVVTSFSHEENAKIQVTGAWGFYGAPPSGSPTNFINKLKKMAKLNLDFFGSHGVLKKEEMRYLDMGIGLYAVTFEVSWEQYLKLIKLCADKIKNHDEAVGELKQLLGQPENRPNHAEIFKAEKDRAAREHRPPRLEPFDFTLPTMHTCKSVAYSLLNEIGIPEEELQQWLEPNKTFPRPYPFTNKLEPVYFHSSGPWEAYKHSTGKVSYHHNWRNKNNKLYWTLPPQILVSKWNNPYLLPAEYVPTIRKYISRLQQIEHIVINARRNESDQAETNETLQRIVEHYTSFATLSRHSSTDEIEQKCLSAKLFLAGIYNTICNNAMFEPAITRIPLESQKEICRILGKPMIKEEYPHPRPT